MMRSVRQLAVPDAASPQTGDFFARDAFFIMAGDPLWSVD
jgi:hypothetical protein